MILQRFKNLINFDQRRLDAALVRIRGKKYLIFAFNVFLLAVNSLGLVKRIAKLVLGKLGLIKSATSFTAIAEYPENMLPHSFTDNHRILIVCEASISQCLRYRVQQKVEQFTSIGQRAKWIDWTDYFEVKNQINFHDIVIFYRVPGYPASTSNIKYAKSLNKLVIYDIDDLVFNRAELESYYKDSQGTKLSKKDYLGVLKGADLYKSAIQLCDFVTTTTPVLKKELEAVLTENQKVYLYPNGIDSKIILAEKNIVIKNTKECVLFYGSGSNTHDKDFDLIVDDLILLFEKYEHVKLMVVGHLTIPSKLANFQSRIYQYGIMPVEQYLVLLKRADINLAPLVSGLFADCKSEIKWLEAAYLGVPSVVSNTDIYQRTVVHGKTGFIADSSINNSWFACLEQLVNDASLRATISGNAKEHIMDNYSKSNIANSFLSDVKDMISINIESNKAIDATKSLKKKVVLVNVLYPPQAMGGATVVVNNIADNLVERFNEAYDVYVFTSDIENLYSYQIKSYSHNHVNVTALSVPKGEDFDIRFKDDNVKEIFEEYLDFIQPDLIHFHCIQGLTASLLEAASSKNIKYFVSAHDSWWLSQHQFLLDKNGQQISSYQSDPIVALESKGNNSEAFIIERSQYLLSLLNQSEKVLAVSEYQLGLYAKNGIENLLVNKNGVDKPLEINDLNIIQDISKYKKADKLVLGYTGSVCHHKGYYFLKRTLESLQCKHIEVLAIDFSAKSNYQETWGETIANHMPMLKNNEMSAFYDTIDVLVVPSTMPESFGIISREATLMNIPSLVSESGGLAEDIIDGVNGWTFPMNDVKAFEQKLIMLDEMYMEIKNTDNVIYEHNIRSINEQVDELADYYFKAINK